MSYILIIIVLLELFQLRMLLSNRMYGFPRKQPADNSLDLAPWNEE